MTCHQARNQKSVEADLGPVLGDVRAPLVLRRRREQRDWVQWTINVTLLVVAMCIMVAVAVSILIGLTLIAKAHEAPRGWTYPHECCSERDCAPINSNRVWALNTGGYVIDGKHHVASDRVRTAPDGIYHACFTVPGNLRCFFAPPKGM